METGRNKIIKSDRRFCELCNSNEVEDELHFVIACNAFTIESRTLYNEIKDKNLYFKKCLK
jgi:hypothetical protein